MGAWVSAASGLRCPTRLTSELTGEMAGARVSEGEAVGFTWLHPLPLRQTMKGEKRREGNTFEGKTRGDDGDIERKGDGVSDLLHPTTDK